MSMNITAQSCLLHNAQEQGVGALQFCRVLLDQMKGSAEGRVLLACQCQGGGGGTEVMSHCLPQVSGWGSATNSSKQFK